MSSSTAAAATFSEPPAIVDLSATMYRCQLDRHTLDRLVHSAGDGIPDCDLRLTTRCDGVRLTAASLDQLESDVCDSRHVDNLQIGVTGQGRRVTVAITPRSITIVVAAPDALWARGKLEQLRSILRRTGGRDRPVRWGELRYAGLTAIIGVLAMVTVVNAGAIGNSLSTLVVAALTVLTLVVYISSLSVYRDLKQRRFDEAVPADATDLYGLTKRLGEEVCRAAVGEWGLSVNVLRLAWPTPDETWPAWGPRSEPQRFYTPDGTLIEPTRASDLARALLAALDHRDGFQLFTITGDQSARLWSTAKARDVLGWSPTAAT